MALVPEEAQPVEQGRCLTNFEALAIIQHIRESEVSSRSDNLRQQIELSYKYCEDFSQFSNEEQLSAAKAYLRDALRNVDNEDEQQTVTEAAFDERERQEEHDIVTLLNLCPDTVADARAYVHSALVRKSDDEVQEILNQLEPWRQ